MFFFCNVRTHITTVWQYNELIDPRAWVQHTSTLKNTLNWANVITRTHTLLRTHTQIHTNLSKMKSCPDIHTHTQIYCANLTHSHSFSQKHGNTQNVPDFSKSAHTAHDSWQSCRQTHTHTQGILTKQAPAYLLAPEDG